MTAKTESPINLGFFFAFFSSSNGKAARLLLNKRCELIKFFWLKSLRV